MRGRLAGGPARSASTTWTGSATDARSRSVETVFLSAADDDVARIYARLGFRHIAAALIAEPAE